MREKYYIGWNGDVIQTAVSRQSASYPLNYLSTTGGTCVSAVFWACSVITVHTNIHSTFTNWLIEPLSYPLPMCATFVVFNSYRNCRVETKRSLFLLFTIGGKYTKATNSSLVLIRKTDNKGHPERCTTTQQLLFMKQSRWKLIWVQGEEESTVKDATVACQHTLTTARTHTHTHIFFRMTSKELWNCLAESS